MAYQTPSPGPQQQYATPEHGYPQQQQLSSPPPEYVQQPQGAPHHQQPVSEDHIQQYQPYQQQAQPQMQCNGSQPQVVQPRYAPGANVNQQEWQNSLCDCSPADTCLLGCFCPCIQTFNTDCLLMCGIVYFTGCGWIYVMLKRNEIRKRFGISGDGAGDCCTTYWCPCCALIQQDNEVEGRLAAGPNTTGYRPNKEGMTMQMFPQAPQYTGKQ